MNPLELAVEAVEIEEVVNVELAVDVAMTPEELMDLDFTEVSASDLNLDVLKALPDVDFTSVTEAYADQGIKIIKQDTLWGFGQPKVIVEPMTDKEIWEHILEQEIPGFSGEVGTYGPDGWNYGGDDSDHLYVEIWGNVTPQQAQELVDSFSTDPWAVDRLNFFDGDSLTGFYYNPENIYSPELAV